MQARQKGARNSTGPEESAWRPCRRTKAWEGLGGGPLSQVVCARQVGGPDADLGHCGSELGVAVGEPDVAGAVELGPGPLYWKTVREPDVKSFSRADPDRLGMRTVWSVLQP